MTLATVLLGPKPSLFIEISLKCIEETLFSKFTSEVNKLLFQFQDRKSPWTKTWRLTLYWNFVSSVSLGPTNAWRKCHWNVFGENFMSHVLVSFDLTVMSDIRYDRLNEVAGVRKPFLFYITNGMINRVWRSPMFISQSQVSGSDSRSFADNYFYTENRLQISLFH